MEKTKIDYEQRVMNGLKRVCLISKSAAKQMKNVVVELGADKFYYEFKAAVQDYIKSNDGCEIGTTKDDDWGMFAYNLAGVNVSWKKEHVLAMWEGINLQIDNELISEARKHFAWCVWAFAKYAKENNQDKCVYLNNAVQAFKFFQLSTGVKWVGHIPVRSFAGFCFGMIENGKWQQTEAEKETWESIDVGYWYKKGLENLNLKNYENQL